MTIGGIAAACLASAKRCANEGVPTFCLPVGSPERAQLRPIATEFGSQDPRDVEMITAWRNTHGKHAPAEFEATVPRTRSWLADVVGPSDSKILFMVDMPRRGPIGHMGLAFIDWGRGYGEADAVLRGQAIPPGLVQAALMTLLSSGPGSLVAKATRGPG